MSREEIDIRPTARLMLEEIGHPFADGEPVYDITFENVQAGLRTDYLFRLANQRNGFVLGTGDPSLTEQFAALERRHPGGQFLDGLDQEAGDIAVSDGELTCLVVPHHFGQD